MSEGGDKWRETMEKLGKSVSNKDRFEKLKESRQKYKDEADEAKKRCARLEEQIEMLQQETANDDPAASSSSSSAAAATAAAAEEIERDLRLQLKVSQEISKRLEQQLTSLKAAMAKCEANLATAEKEASAAKQQLAAAQHEAAAAAAAAAAGAAAGEGPGTDEFTMYLQGAVVGAGVVAVVGYVMLTFAMRR